MGNRRRGGVAVLEIPSSHAGYGDAPWCAVMNIGTGEMYWDCQYQTFDACVPNVIAGNRGFCNVNPTYVPAAPAPPGITCGGTRRSIRKSKSRAARLPNLIGAFA